MDESICSQEKYFFGKSIADAINEVKNDKSKLIKQIKNRKEADVSKQAGELGVGPKIYDIITCIHTEKKPKYNATQQRKRARGETIPPEEIQYETKEKEMNYMVMQNIDGHELRKEEVDDKIDEIYDKYSLLFENGIELLDMARQNTMIDKSGRVYLIDYEHTTTPYGNAKKQTKEELRDFLYHQKLYQKSRSQSRSRSRSRSHSKGGKNKKTHRNLKKPISFKKCLAPFEIQR